MQTNTNETFYIPEKLNEKTWNKWLDDWQTKSKWFQIKNNEYKPTLKNIPPENITPQMVERAIKELKKEEIYHVPSINKKINKLPKKEQENYQKWLKSLTTTQKEQYQKWYENLWLNHLEKTNDYNEIYSVLEKEDLTENINKACIKISPKAIENLPLPETPEELTKYQELLKYALNQQKPEKINANKDILKNIPRKYINKSIIKIGIEKSPIYLNYLNPNDEEYIHFLNLAYKNKPITPREKQLIKRLALTNAELFSTLKLEILKSKIVNTIGESNLEKIVRYKELQNKIITIASDKDALKTFAFLLKNQKENYEFQEIPIEKISTAIYQIQTETNQNILTIISKRLSQKNIPLSEYEKTIIPYLLLQEKIGNITNYNDILTFVETKDKELEKIIKTNTKEPQKIKEACIEISTGLTYKQATNLVKIYGDNAEELLQEYKQNNKDKKQKEEQNALELLINIKKNLKNSPIKTTKKSSYQRYKNSINIENILKRAYGRNLTNTLNQEDQTKTQTIYYNGEPITIKKLTNFTRLVTLLEAYGKHAEDETSIYKKWNTNQMANNHALCYSLINESNPGTAKINKREGIIISIKNIIPEALLASAPYDLCSDTRKPIPTTKRDQKFLTAKNMPNQTRDRYNEYDIEMQNKRAKNYQKIQPSSIICFEKITEESLKAAQELQKKLNKTIPIELIDRKELAKNEMKKIQTALNNFKQKQEIDETLIKEIITRFQNVRNAHISSDISQEIIGENAPFNIKNLNKILKECLNDITKNKKKSLPKLEAITKIITEERQKPHLLETLEQKEKWIGISKEIDKELEKLKQNQQNQIETETKSKIKLAKLESTKEKLKIFKIELKTLKTKPKKDQTTRR